MSSPTGPTFPSEAAAPPGYQTVTPWIISSDTARLIEFTEAAFGARELGRVPGPHGGIGHAEVRIGDSVVMMFDAGAGRTRRPSCACTWPTPMRRTRVRWPPEPRR